MEFKSAFDEEQGIEYQPWTDGYAVGFKCIHPGGRVEYIYLNPSQTNPGTDDTPNVFLYHGTTGEPWSDGALVHVSVFVDLFGVCDNCGVDATIRTAVGRFCGQACADAYELR